MSAIVEWLLAKQWRVPFVFSLIAIVPDSAEGGWYLIALIASTFVLALATLRYGHGRGLQLVFTGAIAVVVVGYLMQRFQPGVAHPDIISRAILWTPALVIAAIIRRTQSLVLGLQVLLLIGFAVVAVVFAVSDPVAYWTRLEMSPNLARVATGGSAAAQVAFVMLAVLLARRGDLHMAQQDGREEFARLSLGKWLATLTGAVFLLGLIPSAVFFANAIWVLGVGFAVQGLAVANAWMVVRGLTGAWALVLYAAMILSIAVTLPLMAGLGFIDSWTDLRRRFGSPGAR